MNLHDIITIQGRMFQVKRKFPLDRLNLNVDNWVNTLKQYYYVDYFFQLYPCARPQCGKRYG